GDRAWLSRVWAAALWEMCPIPDGTPVDVTVEAAGARSRRGVGTRRTAAMPPHDVTTRTGIPVTTPARTLLDLAATVPQHDLRRALDEAEKRNLVTRRELEATLGRHRG